MDETPDLGHPNELVFEEDLDGFVEEIGFLGLELPLIGISSLNLLVATLVVVIRNSHSKKVRIKGHIQFPILRNDF